MACVIKLFVAVINTVLLQAIVKEIHCKGWLLVYDNKYTSIIDMYFYEYFH